MEAKLVSNLCGIHGIWKILFVSKDKEDGIAELVFVEHAMEFITGFPNAIAIVTIHDEDEALGVLEVVSPQRTDLERGRSGG